MTNSPKRMKWQKPLKLKPPISQQPTAIKLAWAFGVQTTKTEQSKMANYSEALIVKIETELMASKSGHYKLKNADFKKLERYQDGAIVNLYAIFYLLTKSQINRLTGDDQSRYEDYDEELRCMRHDAEEEFKAYS